MLIHDADGGAGSVAATVAVRAILVLILAVRKHATDCYKISVQEHATYCCEKRQRWGHAAGSAGGGVGYMQE